MVLLHWFERFLGPVAAPDEKYQPPDVEDSPFWSTVAPDPNFPPGGRAELLGRGVNSLRSAAAPPGGALTPLRDGLVECLHCHRMTPSTPAASLGGDSGVRRHGTVVFSTPPVPTSATSATVVETPPAYVASASSSSSLRKSPWTGTPSRRGVAKVNPALGARIVEAAVATVSLSSTANTIKLAKADELLKLVHGEYNDKKHKALAELIKKDWLEMIKKDSDEMIKEDSDEMIEKDSDEMIEKKSHVLVYARVQKAQGKGLESCEGYTALHTACNRGNDRAVELMLNAPVEVAKELVQLTNLQGETALHLACARGHDAIANRLQAFYELHGLDLLRQDILGRTPLASALMSPLCSSVKKSSLFESLRSPDDPCVFGKFIPPSDRNFYLPSRRVAVGISELPGKRGSMEDATLVALRPPSEAGENEGDVVIAGVLDGHDDGGKFSQEAADSLRDLLIELASNSRVNDVTAIQDIFQRVDDEIREKSIPGGTTACVSIITDHWLQVANVGDSRCVLVQRVPDESLNVDATEPLEERMERLSLSKNEIVTKVNGTWYEVVPMSHDHKPDLEKEKNRIEAAGLEVIHVDVSENQKVHKVKSSNGSELAMSRSLGDYEFKDKKDLTSDQQAVIATPEVVTRERSRYDEFLIVACDGVWDVMTNKEAADFVAEKLQELQTSDDHVLARVADLLCRKCLDIGSEDNISVVLVALGETAERLTPAATSTPAISTIAVARKLEYESPTVEPSVAVTAALPVSDEVQPISRTPGQVQTL